MIEVDKIAENLFDKIRSRFSSINIGDESAKSTLDPTKARFFNFDYTVDNRDIGNITLSLADDQSLKIYFDKDLDSDMDDAEKQTWYAFLKDLRLFAKRNLLSFDIRDIAKSGLNIKDLKHADANADIYTSDELNLNENKLYGTSRSSYEKLKNVKLIARHRKPVDEQQLGARTRNIDRIYIENSDGERFKLPDGTTVNGARVYARHVMNGGSIHDDFGQHIGQLLKDMNSLKIFVRNMRGREFDDAETKAMVESAIDHYGSLHRDVHIIKGQKGYERYIAEWQNSLPSPDEIIDIDSLREKFSRRIFDERLVGALPLVQKAYNTRKNQIEAEFESWANGVIEAHEEADPGEFSPFANSLDSDSAGNAQDLYDQLFTNNGFDYKYLDGKYYFESVEELERAKDIIAAYDPKLKYPAMGVYDYDGGVYGSSTFDRDDSGYSSGVMESSNDSCPVCGQTPCNCTTAGSELNFIKRLAGLTK